MNRCTHHSPTPATVRRRPVTAGIALALLVLATSAGAQLTIRAFPPKAERGAMQITNPPDMLLNSKADRLSPGARIHGTNNMLVMSGALVGQNLVVNFVREPNGMVHEVWILNDAEAALKLPQPVAQ